MRMLSESEGSAPCAGLVGNLGVEADSLIASSLYIPPTFLSYNILYMIEFIPKPSNYYSF